MVGLIRMANQHHAIARQEEFDALLKRFPPRESPSDTGLWIQVIVCYAGNYELPVFRWIPSREEMVEEWKNINKGRKGAKELGVEWRDRWHGPMDINQLVPKESVPCPQDAAKKST